MDAVLMYNALAEVTELQKEKNIRFPAEALQKAYLRNLGKSEVMPCHIQFSKIPFLNIMFL